MQFKLQHGVLFLLLVTAMTCFGQTSEQKALEEKREQLQSEIRNINRLLFAEKKEKFWIKWKRLIRKLLCVNN